MSTLSSVADMSDLSQVIKALCAGSLADGRAAEAISPATMRGAFAAILDGGASDLEIGALMAVSALLEAQCEGEKFAELILGLHDAIRERMLPLHCEHGSGPIVVLPNYGDAGRTASIPLLALLLRRFGIRVLVHGALETYGGLFNCGIFRDFDVLPATTRSQAEKQLCDGGIALVPATLFSPGLAAMLSLKNRVSAVTPAHTLASLLMPLSTASRDLLHVLEIPAWLRGHLDGEEFLSDARVLLLSVSPDHFELNDFRPRIAFHNRDNPGGWEQLFAAEPARVTRAPRADAATNTASMSTDPRAWSNWTRSHLAGEAILPLPIVNLLASCLYGCGYAPDINQAKAIASVGAGSRAAA